MPHARISAAIRRRIRTMPQQELERSTFLPTDVIADELARRHALEGAHKQAKTPRQ